MRINNSKKSICDGFACFVYATLIVDLYRKFSLYVVALPLGISTFRNLVYVFNLFLVFWSERRLRIYSKLVVISCGFLAMNILSWLINWDRNATSLYMDLIFMFFSRLMPAYYIGTQIVGKEHEFVKSVNKLQILTVCYIALILAYPETSETSYLTISGNLLIPVLVAVLGRKKGSGDRLSFAVGIVGLLIILIYGGRTSMVAIVLAFALVLLAKLQSTSLYRRIVVILGIVATVVLILVLYPVALEYLVEKNPSSRTLRLLAEGEFFWMSNRENYYEAAFNSLLNHPFRVYGFLGDRFYYADTFGSAGDNSVIVTLFSHNTMLELMLNFGLFIGLAINLYFVYKLICALGTLRRRGNTVCWNVHIVLFASAFAPLFVSSSWLNDYTIWLMAGTMLALASSQVKRQYNPGEEETHE